MKSSEPVTWGQYAKQLAELIDSTLWGGQELPLYLEAEALALMAEFFQRREELQRPFVLSNGKLPPDKFSPLGMYVRWAGRNRTLEVGWHLQHFHKGKRRKPIHLKKGKGTRYPLSLLQRHALPFECELVLEIEERAECIRRRWAWAQKVRMANRFLAADPYAREKATPTSAADANTSEEMAVLPDGTCVPLPPGVTQEQWLKWRDGHMVEDPHPRDLLPSDSPLRRLYD